MDRQAVELPEKTKGFEETTVKPRAGSRPAPLSRRPARIPSTRRSLDGILLDDAFDHLRLALDAIERHAACCRRKQAQNSEDVVRKSQAGWMRPDDLADFEHMRDHGIL